MRQVNDFLAVSRNAYLRQAPWVRVLLPVSVLILFCCICLIPISILRPRNSANPVPSPVVLPTQGTQASPTPLFGFDLPTFTPFPTSTPFVPSPFPTWTPLPTFTATQTSTQIPPTATLTPTFTPIPTNTVTSTPTRTSAVGIISVDKVAEYVEIQNRTQAPVDLRGWRLLSETGNESCPLTGTLAPNQVLRIWARRGNPGFDCRLGREIWLDNQADPAVLYNPQGQEISRYP